MDDLVHGSNPHASLAREYLDALLVARTEEASRLILDAAASGTSVKDLYLQVLQPVQHEIGRLWQVNQVTVAQEHYCSAVTQLVMGRLFSYLPAGSRNGKSVVVTCVGGELHEIGARMVADMLESSGWDSYFLGASTPTGSVLSAVADRQAHLLAVSVTIHFNVDTARRLIEEIRTSPDASGLKIMVGGRSFLVAPDLWRSIGADASAADAGSAVAAAAALVGRGEQLRETSGG